MLCPQAPSSSQAAAWLSWAPRILPLLSPVAQDSHALLVHRSCGADGCLGYSLSATEVVQGHCQRNQKTGGWPTVGKSSAQEGLFPSFFSKCTALTANRVRSVHLIPSPLKKPTTGAHRAHVQFSVLIKNILPFDGQNL